jgi:putative component of membrane protein insertase Oxa1/YidC/SpoIIIJ protein YidD
MRWLAIAAVRFYQRFLRRLVGRRCLYSVTCSEYAIAAFRAGGLVLGWRRTRARLRSCRMPARAAWAIGADGRPELVDVEAPDGVAWEVVPERLGDGTWRW